MTRYSLDSDVLTAILKREQAIVAKLLAKLEAKDEIIICPFVYYEVKRGLLDMGAINRMQDLESFVASRPWREFDRNIWITAAEGWAKNKGIGAHHEDPDLLIAYHAIRCDAVVVTFNTKHFSQFPAMLEDWSAG
ncbi:MAG TPA: PIN domain-containing protein [Thermoanaerobaculia bacterium]|nr:PIN domain-containing protein [Thermoanaerobaculia bacterium]